MSLINRLGRIAICVVAVSVIGCGDSGVNGSAVKAPTPFDAAAANARAVSEATSRAAEADAQGTPADMSATLEKTVEKVAYESPFPDRLNLFEPQKRSARAAKRSSGDVADSVVLMGFAKLDEPKVVLAIDGIVSPLADGQEFGGVTVISIAPPRAVLQRGRNRWTASIE